MSARKQVEVNFGQFLSDLSGEQQGVSAEVLKELHKEFIDRKKVEVKRRLENIYERMQQHVASLRQVRRQEKAIQVAMKELQDEANNVVKGLSTD